MIIAKKETTHSRLHAEEKERLYLENWQVNWLGGTPNTGTSTNNKRQNLMDVPYIIAVVFHGTRWLTQMNWT
jgi:hypothetical protein